LTDALPVAEARFEARLKASSHLLVSNDYRRHWSVDVLWHSIGRDEVLLY